jgi:hypothetical protein
MSHLPPIHRAHNGEQEPLLGEPGANQQPVQATLGHNLISGTAPLAQLGGLILAFAVFYAVGTHEIMLFSAHPVSSSR